MSNFDNDKAFQKELEESIASKAKEVFGSFDLIEYVYKIKQKASLNKVAFINSSERVLILKS